MHGIQVNEMQNAIQQQFSKWGLRTLGVFWDPSTGFARSFLFQPGVWLRASFLHNILAITTYHNRLNAESKWASSSVMTESKPTCKKREEIHFSHYFFFNVVSIKKYSLGYTKWVYYLKNELITIYLHFLC